jgi:hypothetical protein
MELDSGDDNPNDKGKQPVHYTMKQFEYHAVVIERLYQHQVTHVQPYPNSQHGNPYSNDPAIHKHPFS